MSDSSEQSVENLRFFFLMLLRKISYYLIYGLRNSFVVFSREVYSDMWRMSFRE